jgi:beta-lactamase superfamily II metal-dependent hydrolase
MTMKRLVRAATGTAIASLLLIPLVALGQGDLEIHCLSVGQGDCTLIISPTGGTLLFDAGNNGKGNSTVIPYMQSLGLTALDYVSCSHYHADHIGGLDEVVNNIGRDSVRVAALDRGWSYTTATYNSYAAAVGPKRTTILDGQVIDLGGGVTVTCCAVNGNGQLSPPFAGSDDENDYCVALLVEYGDFEFFVAGDLSGVNSSYYTDIESSVCLEVGDIDVYRVDHHGSSSNSNNNLVSTLQAEAAIISVGSNSYGHPTQTVLNRLVSHGSYIYQTGAGSGGTIPPGEGEVVGGHVVIVVSAGQYTVDGDVYDLGSAGIQITDREISLKVFPNPFTSQTTFGFSLPGEGRVTLDVFDTTGRMINRFSTPGSTGSTGSLTWDGRTISGETVSPGVYFVRLRGASMETAHKVVKR